MNPLYILFSLSGFHVLVLDLCPGGPIDLLCPITRVIELCELQCHMMISWGTSGFRLAPNSLFGGKRNMKNQHLKVNKILSVCFSSYYQ